MRRIITIALALLVISAPVQALAVPASYLSGLHWRLIGPFRGGRALAVTGVPGQPNLFYFGAVGGGVWKTINAGRTWDPIFDAIDVPSIGAIAVAPSDPNIIYVGTGEADMRSDIQHGNGMYKSSDGGQTWTHIGLEDSRQIGRIVIDPRDAQTLYVAALGHQYGPNAQRGVFKSTDGGKTWNKILYLNANTGAIDLSRDPSNPDVLFASMWQTRRPPWNVYPPSNGPSSGLYKTLDAGKTWNPVMGQGFPGGTIGHIGVSISPANHNRVYTIVDTNDPKTGGIYRSDDGGATWTHTDGEQRIWKRGWYFGQITADSKNENTVYVMNTSTYRSTDGGKSFDAIKGAPGGDDYHSAWIDPDDPRHIILGSDQGVVITLDGAKTWSSWYNQPTGQFYHVITDNRFPYWVYGAQQDSGAMSVPSRSIHAGIGMHDWQAIDAGGESGTIAPDPLHPGKLAGNPPTYEDVQTTWELTIDPTIKYPDKVWRNTWTLPIAVSPQNPRVLYMSHQQIFRSADFGKSWQIISPDLTRPTNTVPPNLDPPTIADSTGLARRGVVYWIAPSAARAHEIWAGTDDGFIWITRDEGSHWQNVTPAQLTPWSKVGVIDASHFDAQTAYAAIDRHRLDDNKPYIYSTHNGGRSWALITNGIPADESVNVVREDPKRRGLLYAGTERGVYVSLNDGGNWQSLRMNMPAASIRDIVFRNDDVILATHGRAFWILDNVSPLRQAMTAASTLRSYLFKPAVAYRTRPGSDQGTPNPPEEPIAKNPYTGAAIDYYIDQANTPVVLEIRDANGRVVRKWSSADKLTPPNPKDFDIPAYWLSAPQALSADPGSHRFIWDLHYAGTSRRARRSGGGPLAPPGIYNVRLSVNGHMYSQALTLRRDPTYPASNADLRAQFQFAQAINAVNARVTAASTKATDFMKSHTAANYCCRAQMQALIGKAPVSTPDDSVGKPAMDFNSLRYIGSALSDLESAVESVDARPTPDQYTAFKILRAKATRTIDAITALENKTGTR